MRAALPSFRRAPRGSRRQTVDRAGAHQRQHLAGAGDIGQQAPRTKTARVLADLGPDADHLAGIVLVEELDAAGPALRQRTRESARHHDVAAEILGAEQRRIALERPVGPDAFRLEPRRLALRASPFSLAHA